MTIRFVPGHSVITPLAEELVPRERVIECLHRHLSGDWGLVPEEDAAMNEASLVPGRQARLMSVYAVDEATSGDEDAPRFWIITEADRSCTTVLTTVLMPDDY